MEQGVPIIHSATMRSETLGLRGIADLLVRVDDYYVVVDIKLASIPFKANGHTILNTGHFPSYKGQLWVYNELLAEIQGDRSPKAFLLARNSPRLEIVDFESDDNTYVEKSKAAVQWIRSLHANGATWTLNPPSNNFFKTKHVRTIFGLSKRKSAVGENACRSDVCVVRGP